MQKTFLSEVNIIEINNLQELIPKQHVGVSDSPLLETVSHTLDIALRSHLWSFFKQGHSNRINLWQKYNNRIFIKITYAL